MRYSHDFNWKLTGILLICASCILALLYFALPGWIGNNGVDNTDGRPEDGSNEKIAVSLTNLTVVVLFHNGTTEMNNDIALYNTNGTVFDVTCSLYAIKYDVYPSGYIIVEINGDRGGWVYEVNGAMPGIACNKFFLDNNSIIEWRGV
ncbi:MAG: DUF4430 domain-containing protein [Promethearchaeota archaeon]